MEETAEPAAEGVLVARVVGPLASTPCDRCGGFAVLTRRDGRMLCAPCVERTLHEIETTPPQLQHLIAGTWQVFKAAWWRAWLMLLAVSVLQQVLTPLFPLSALVQLALAPVAALSLAAVVHLGLQVIDPDLPRGISGALRQAVRTWPSLLGAMFFAGFAVAVGMALFLFPGFYLLLGFAVMVPLVVSGEDFAEAMAKSLERLEGRRLEVLGSLIVAGIPFLGGNLVLFGILFVVAVTGRLSPVAMGLWNVMAAVLYPLLALPPVFLSVVLHAKLRPRAAPAAG